MSSSIWTRCGGSSSCGRFDAKPWRVVEAQHRSSTLKLVDTLAEQDVLERLIDDSKPPLPPGRELERLHWLLFTPFRYPPLKHGSRFGRRHERAIWYGSDEMRTALAEDAYYRLVFFSGTEAKLSPHRIARSVFQARVGTAAGIDLSRSPFTPFLAQLRSRTDYSATQQLGSEMRADGIEAFRYTSARAADAATNIGLFSPKAFASTKPITVPQSWNCTITTAGDVAFEHETVGGVDRFLFHRSDFLVDGQLPSPVP